MHIAHSDIDAQHHQGWHSKSPPQKEKNNKTHFKKPTESVFFGFFHKMVFFSQILDENEYSLDINQFRVI